MLFVGCVFLICFVLKYGSDSNVTKQTLYTDTLFNPLQWWDSMFGKDELLQCNTIDNIVLKIQLNNKGRHFDDTHFRQFKEYLSECVSICSGFTMVRRQ